jgi:HD-GYP domain-containing protein (c-di-GMP phosphodiesterase class II)
VADTIDAMTTDRPYRKRLPLEVVIGELQKCRGSQFDPDIVELAVSSVAVRRLITTGVQTSAFQTSSDRDPLKERRSGWSGRPFWKNRQA